MVQVVLEVDVLVVVDGYADETTRTCRVNEWLLLVGGADERGVATELLDGLAVGWAELHFG